MRNKHSSQVNDFKDEIQELKLETKTKNKTINNLETQIKDYASLIESNKATIDDLNRMNQEFKVILDWNKDTIKNLNAELNALNKTTKNQSLQVSMLDPRDNVCYNRFEEEKHQTIDPIMLNEQESSI